MKQSLLLILFIFGLFLPTSIGGVINPNLPKGYAILAIPVFVLFIIQYGKGRISRNRMIIAFLINAVLWGSTLITPLNSYAFGNAIFYLLFSLMICLNIRNEELDKKKVNLANIVHLINLSLCFFITVQNQTIMDFFINNYSLYYPEMMEYALLLKKPVIMFTAHSLAGFYLFLFFFISFSAYKFNQNKFNLVISILYLYFIFLLKSNAGYAFFFIGIMMFLHYLYKNRSLKILFTTLIGSVILIIFSLVNSDAFSKYYNLMVATLSSNNNGLAGRYSENGILSGNFNFMKEHIFFPVGFGNSEALFFGDSGLVEYILRGSFLLVFLMYLGLFLFLRQNLASRSNAYLLFIFLFIIDIGAPALINYRTLFILPFIIVFLNKASNKNAQSSTVTVLKSESTNLSVS